MNAPTSVQTIFADGKPAFVVIPYAEYLKFFPKGRRPADGSLPHEVVGLAVKDGMSLPRAWREHLGLTQGDVAARIGITQAALAQTEAAKRPRKATLARLAAALGIGVEQLR